MASDNMNHRRLQELGESNFEMADGQPDIRGWDVKTNSDEEIGEVEELIFDARTRKVRYLVVDISDNDTDREDREVLVPIGHAELDMDDDEVILKNISMEQLRALPAYDENNLTEDVERKICQALGRDTSTYGTGELNEDFYRHEQFNDSNLYRKRLPASTTSDPDGIRLRDRLGASGSEVEGYLSEDGSERAKNRRGIDEGPRPI